MLRIIFITPDGVDPAPAIEAALAALPRGAAGVQLRQRLPARALLERARTLRAICTKFAAPLMVNDRADVALAAGAAGVHVGVDDIAPRALRRVVPAAFIIGCSVGTELEVARSEGADYVGIGPLYPTGSKHDAGAAIGPAGFAALRERCGLPAVAIGGISASNAAEALAAGAAGVAVISAVFGVPDPSRGAREIRRALAASGR